MLIAHAATFPRRTSIRTGTFPLPLAHAAIFLAAVFLISGIFAPRLQAQYCGLVNAPPEALRNQPLPNGALAGISGAMGREENKYQAAPLGDGFQMESSALRADFTPVRVDFYAQGERWSTRLESYGRGDSVAILPPVAPTGNGNRVEYRRGSFTEWYLNGPMGLEQGFTLTRRATARRANLSLSHSRSPAIFVARLIQAVEISNSPGAVFPSSDTAVSPSPMPPAATSTRGWNFPAICFGSKWRTPARNIRSPSTRSCKSPISPSAMAASSIKWAPHPQSQEMARPSSSARATPRFTLRRAGISVASSELRTSSPAPAQAL